MAEIEACEVAGCERPRMQRSPLCSAHGWRKRVHGDVVAHIPIGAGRWLRGEAGLSSAAEVARVAYAPTPAEGRGFLWLV